MRMISCAVWSKVFLTRLHIRRNVISPKAFASENGAQGKSPEGLLCASPERSEKGTPWRQENIDEKTVSSFGCNGLRMTKPGSLTTK